MTKKDYELIAKVFHDCLRIEQDIIDQRHTTNETIKSLECCAIRMSVKLGVENAKFDSAKFLIGCGVKNG
jgi:hypothetical protein